MGKKWICALFFMLDLRHVELELREVIEHSTMLWHK